MKRFLVASSVVIVLLAHSCQTASAWKSCKFGIGLNIEYASGNNGCCWGLFHNGQVPCPYDLYGPGYAGPGIPPGYSMYYGGYGHAAAAPGVGPGFTPATPVTPANDFVPPSPTPLGAYGIPVTNYGYPTVYPANYQPMSYPAGFFPMSYSFYGQ